MDAAARLGMRLAVAYGPRCPTVSSAIKKQQSLSYEELSRANRGELERLAEADLLDGVTRASFSSLNRNPVAARAH
jgi:hypothetical protein